MSVVWCQKASWPEGGRLGSCTEQCLLRYRIRTSGGDTNEATRGWLDYEERVSSYWPEFAQQGKERITVRQLLAHQAGLYALDEPIDRSLVTDLDRLAVVLARQKPAWEPGTRQAYHGITLGFYESELLRRIDSRHRSLGQFFQDEIATPLGLDVYIRLPDDVPNSRLATIARPTWLQIFQGFPLRLAS